MNLWVRPIRRIDLRRYTQPLYLEVTCHPPTITQSSSRRRRYSEQRAEIFGLLVDAVKDYAIIMLGPDGRVASWNPGAERIKGYRAEEIIGRHFSCFYTDEDIERDKPARELTIAATQGRVEDEGWRVRKDGSRFWANVIIIALRDEAGGLRGFAKVTRDLTEHRRAEESLLSEITNVLVSNLDIRRLLSAISASIRRVMPHDYASLELYDEKSGELRRQSLDDPYTEELIPAGMRLPVEGSSVRLGIHQPGNLGAEPIGDSMTMFPRSGDV